MIMYNAAYTAYADFIVVAKYSKVGQAVFSRSSHFTVSQPIEFSFSHSILKGTIMLDIYSLDSIIVSIF